jgi:hypothetical protein
LRTRNEGTGEQVAGRKRKRKEEEGRGRKRKEEEGRGRK